MGLLSRGVLQIPLHCSLIALLVLAVMYRVRISVCPSPASEAGVKPTAQGNGSAQQGLSKVMHLFLDLVIQDMERDPFPLKVPFSCAVVKEE